MSAGCAVNNLVLPYPPTANNLYRNLRTGGRVKTGHYNAWLADALALLRGQRFTPVEGSYRLRIFVDRPDNRARDIDNTIKPVSDLLKKAGVISDDSKARSVLATWTDAPAKKPGGLRIELEAA